MPLLDKLFGRRLASSEEEEQKVGIWAGIPMLGLDGLSSAAYGPEVALTVLLPLGVMGLTYIGPIIAVIVVILAILYFSYRQTIAAYPSGGGSYTVARANLGEKAGLLAAAALLLDYILNVAVGISAGMEALVSAVPVLHPYTVWLCLFTLALITLVNLRGIRESGVAFALPTYLFVGSLAIVICVGIVKSLLGHGHPLPAIAPPALPVAITGVTAWLIIRAFATGCTAMTGVEAVSNGVGAFARPAVVNAQRTLTGIVVILGLLLGGISYLAPAYRLSAPDPGGKVTESILSQLTHAIVGNSVFYWITMGSVLSVLALSANTSFADFPRLCRLLASDDFLPHAFANRGRRLVYSIGIAILAGLAGLLLILFGGITDRLIPLFAVGAFLAFTLSQAGMVVHWRRNRGKKSGAFLLVNGLGAISTGIALAVILVAKFTEGAWITLLLIPSALIVFVRVKRHYEHVRQEIRCPRPLDVSRVEPPIVVVPVKSWSLITESALHFAINLSAEIIAVHISSDEGAAYRLKTEWERCVSEPIAAAKLPQPKFMILSSPYRRLFSPLLDYIAQLKEEYPGRQIAVIIPELVEARWYQYLLHTQRATGLKAALLLRGGHRVVVINVPWYLAEQDGDD
jgi:amino acid transporter